jgi:hypothetical protein
MLRRLRRVNPGPPPWLGTGGAPHLRVAPRPLSASRRALALEELGRCEEALALLSEVAGAADCHADLARLGAKVQRRAEAQRKAALWSQPAQREGGAAPWSQAAKQEGGAAAEAATAAEAAPAAPAGGAEGDVEPAADAAAPREAPKAAEQPREADEQQEQQAEAQDQQAAAQEQQAAAQEQATAAAPAQAAAEPGPDANQPEPKEAPKAARRRITVVAETESEEEDDGAAAGQSGHAGQPAAGHGAAGGKASGKPDASAAQRVRIVVVEDDDSSDEAEEAGGGGAAAAAGGAAGGAALLAGPNGSVPQGEAEGQRQDAASQEQDAASRQQEASTSEHEASEQLGAGAARSGGAKAAVPPPLPVGPTETLPLPTRRGAAPLQVALSAATVAAARAAHELHSQECRDSLVKALTSQPRSAPPASTDDEDEGKALREMREAFAQHSKPRQRRCDEADAQMSQADALLRAGKAHNALTALARACKLAPTDARPHALCAQVCGDAASPDGRAPVPPAAPRPHLQCPTLDCLGPCPQGHRRRPHVLRLLPLPGTQAYLKLKRPDKALLEADAALAMELVPHTMGHSGCYGPDGSEWRPQGRAWLAGALVRRAAALRGVGRTKDALQVGKWEGGRAGLQAWAVGPGASQLPPGGSTSRARGPRPPVWAGP